MPPVRDVAKKKSPERSAHDQGIGRSRGGNSSKIMLTATDEDTAIVVEVIPGQASDAPQLKPVLAQTLKRVEVVDELIGDKGFDGNDQRQACIDNDVFPNIPNRKNRIDPWPCDMDGYKERNRVERLFCKMKQFRRVATRYEKLKVTFLGMIQIVLGFIRLRRLKQQPIVNTA
jgi:transposase